MNEKRFPLSNAKIADERKHLEGFRDAPVYLAKIFNRFIVGKEDFMYSGNGGLVRNKNGKVFILSAFHVLSGQTAKSIAAPNLVVVDGKNQEFQISAIYGNQKSDLLCGLIDPQPDAARALELSASDVKIDAWIQIATFRKNFQLVTTTTAVSDVRGNDFEYFPAAIPGDSGSPVLDKENRLTGIVFRTDKDKTKTVCRMLREIRGFIDAIQ